MSSISDLEKYAKEHHVPIITPDVRDLLKTIITIKKPKRILEVGTAIGYSALVMLSCSDCYIDTLEIDEQTAGIAKENLKNEKANVINADSTIWIEENSDKKYDLIFLDGPKGQYLKMYPTLLNMLDSGGIIFCDNVLYQGMVRGVDFVPHKKRTIVVNLRKFIKIIEEDETVCSTVLEIGDGVAIIVKN